MLTAIFVSYGKIIYALARALKKSSASLNASVNESSLKNQILKYKPKSKLYPLKFPPYFLTFSTKESIFQQEKVK